MKIRDAIPADVDALLALQKEAPTASQWSHEQYRQAITNREPVRLFLIVEQESEVRGFLVAREIAGEWEIENVIVASEVRRQGYGAQLLAEFFNRARIARAQAIALEVRESNSAARHLYEAYGFKEVSRRKLYYQAPTEDAILYEFKFL